MIEVILDDARWDAFGLQAVAEQAVAATLRGLDLDPERVEVAILGCDDAHSVVRCWGVISLKAGAIILPPGKTRLIFDAPPRSGGERCCCGRASRCGRDSPDSPNRTREARREQLERPRRAARAKAGAVAGDVLSGSPESDRSRQIMRAARSP